MDDRQREHIQAALAFILGPETPYTIRQRAVRRLIRRGANILPDVLYTLNTYPEITMPAWPDWPSQYKLCARLLFHLSRSAHLELATLLRPSPAIPQPGPVLWVAVIEATEFEREHHHEDLLRSGLATPWATVRYAAAMALGTRMGKISLQFTTLQELRRHQQEDEALPVRLASTHALLQNRDASALVSAQRLLEPTFPLEVRKAAAFILSVIKPNNFPQTTIHDIIFTLLPMLRETDHQLSFQVAHTLGVIASPAILPNLVKLLSEHHAQLTVNVLHTLERMSRRRTLCHEMIRQRILPRIVPYCRAPSPEVRRQACHTLAACGGEYASAVLATLLHNSQHPGHLEAIESLRILQSRSPALPRQQVLRWLTTLLSSHAPETSLVMALDTLAYLLWKARTYQKSGWREMCLQIIQEGNIDQLLQNKSAWVRQRSSELLILLGPFREALSALPAMLEHLLLKDEDSGVRACVAYVCGQITARWAIPALILSLLDPNEYVAQTALHALTTLATSDDSIVMYVMRELSHIQDSPNEPVRALAQEAGQFLKKKRRRKHDLSRTTLHGLK